MPTHGDLNEVDKEALQRILGKVPAPERGLPDAVFDFALAIVPMINVDLLVTDENNRVLLAWREDKWGVGWHVPGGIVRAYESLLERIDHTARMELGIGVSHDTKPLSISQFFTDRGHFISLLYDCKIVDGHPVVADTLESTTPSKSCLAWFGDLPLEIYPFHRNYISRLPQFAKSQPLTFSESPIELR